jgi:hypothetical protein
MMLSRVIDRLRRGGGLMLPILALVQGVANAGSPIPALVLDAVSSPWLIALVVIAVGFLPLLFPILAAGDASERRRRRDQRGRLEGFDLPTAISDVNGNLSWSNLAMRNAFGDKSVAKSVEVLPTVCDRWFSNEFGVGAYVVKNHRF